MPQGGEPVDSQLSISVTAPVLLLLHGDGLPSTGSDLLPTNLTISPTETGVDEARS